MEKSKSPLSLFFLLVVAGSAVFISQSEIFLTHTHTQKLTDRKKAHKKLLKIKSRKEESAKSENQQREKCLQEFFSFLALGGNWFDRVWILHKSRQGW